MPKIDIGDIAPDFTLPREGNGEISLSEFKGKKIILFFYPKDNTSGCTKEACAFNENLSIIEEKNTVVIGLSKDSVKSHDKFKEKFDLKFPLASDEECKACDAYGVWVEKSMYGRKYMGIERSTFLIDEDGKISKIWRKVKVKEHVEDVISNI